jgi:hypothetical protein
MTKWKRALGLCVTLVSCASISPALAQQLNSQQIEVIRDTAASICNTVKEAKGQKSDYQIEGDVKAQLGGLVGRLVDVVGSSKGSVSREEFEGLSRDATAAALEGDRGCRERLFDKMFDKLTIPPSEKKSGMSEAERLIATVDLGRTFSNMFSKLVICQPKIPLFDPCSFRYPLEVATINAAAAKLGIPPYVENNIGAKLLPHGMYVHTKYLKYFEYHLHNDPDNLAAFHVGVDIGRLAYGISEYGLKEPSDDLQRQLISLNLGDIMNQIPTSADGAGYSWADDFIASLRGLIHKNYPTMSLSQ